jgi:hypothetical protein
MVGGTRWATIMTSECSALVANLKAARSPDAESQMKREAANSRRDALGSLPLPAALPVITCDRAHSVDTWIRPYLPRLARGALIAWPYAAKADPADMAGIGVPLVLDSGGFLSLSPAATIEQDVVGNEWIGNTWRLVVPGGDGQTEMLCPRALLDFAMRRSEVAAVYALDFAVRQSDTDESVHARQAATVDNARWTVTNNRRRSSLAVCGVAHGRTPDEYASHARAMVATGVDGIGVGGLVPRSARPEELRAICAAVREAVGDMPLHAFGVGSPVLLRAMIDEGVIDSADASTYARTAASLEDATPTERLAAAIDALLDFTQAAVPLARRLP